MSGELLSELRATVNRKCASLKEHPSFANLEASNLIATVGSHDNPGETITGGDIDVALADIAALTDHFTARTVGAASMRSGECQGRMRSPAGAVRKRSTGSSSGGPISGMNGR
jgi:hypothetical protein